MRMHGHPGYPHYLGASCDPFGCDRNPEGQAEVCARVLKDLYDEDERNENL